MELGLWDTLVVGQTVESTDSVTEILVDSRQGGDVHIFDAFNRARDIVPKFIRKGASFPAGEEGVQQQLPRCCRKLCTRISVSFTRQPRTKTILRWSSEGTTTRPAAGSSRRLIAGRREVPELITPATCISLSASTRFSPTLGPRSHLSRMMLVEPTTLLVDDLRGLTRCCGELTGWKLDDDAKPTYLWSVVGVLFCWWSTSSKLFSWLYSFHFANSKHLTLMTATMAPSRKQSLITGDQCNSQRVITCYQKGWHCTKTRRWKTKDNKRYHFQKDTYCFVMGLNVAKVVTMWKDASTLRIGCRSEIDRHEEINQSFWHAKSRLIRNEWMLQGRANVVLVVWSNEWKDKRQQRIAML